jgi:aspartate racemase
MKTIGLIGGMSWESTVEYYRILNEAVKEKLGGLHSARCVIYSLEFQEIEERQQRGAWVELTGMMIDAARRLEKAGAGLLLIGANTMHRMADEVQASISIPLIHIVDAAAAAVKQRSLTKVGLLGTRYTMEQDFYAGRLSRSHGLEVMIPEAEERELIQRVLYQELCLGVLNDASRKAFVKIMENLVAGGAQGIVLGCTEIPLLVNQNDMAVPVFDTTELHARKAVELALAN